MNIYHIRQALRTKSIYDMDLRVAYYARVSTEKEEQKNSIKNQRSHFEELIKSNRHWIFSGGYIDDGISGIHAEKREEFQRMVKDAKNGKFDLLITKEISRFARNTLDSIQYTRELLSYGVCVWFQSDNINTADEDSEFRLTIMAGVAQDEIRKLSSRVRFGHAQSIKNGVVLGNSHIYGYDKEHGKLIINEAEAPMIRIIFDKYASGECSTPRLEKILYEMGYRNYKGGKISRTVIQHIITNPKYKGWYAGGKVKVIDMFTKKQEFLPEEEWYMFKDDGDIVPAIVSEKIWEQANRRFKERSENIKSHRTSFKEGNLFTGKIFCSNDGSTYWMKQHHVRGKEDVKWVCSHRIKNGSESCDSFPLSEHELKVMLSNIIQESAPDIESLVEKYVSIYEKISTQKEFDNTKEIENLKNRIQSIKAKMEKILDYNLNGSISDDEFVRRNREYEKQIKSMEDCICELSKPQTDSGEIKIRLSHIADMVRNCANICADDITRIIIENMIDRILVTPTGEYKANIEFILNSGAEKLMLYTKKRKLNVQNSEGIHEKSLEIKESLDLGCSDNVFLNMLSEQQTLDFTGVLGGTIMLPERHMDFFRHLRSCEGHSLKVSYTYSLAI